MLKFIKFIFISLVTLIGIGAIGFSIAKYYDNLKFNSKLDASMDDDLLDD